MIHNKIKVLIVDDSIVFRQLLSKGISSDPNIEVVATANDPFDASEKIVQYKPDVITCDVEMPKMNGIEFVKQLMPQYPLPVIVVSGVSGVVFDAMDAGAVDFVAKPNVKSVKDVENFIHSMIEKIKIVSNAKVKHLVEGTRPKPLELKNNILNNTIIAMGASTGGTEALHHILAALPKSFPGIVIVQHIPPVFSKMFAERLNKTTNLTVKEAETGDVVESGKVFIAPGDKHMRVKKIGEKYRIECFEDAKVSGHCPSVDVLFESIAKSATSNAIGIILTGMGYDGAKGLLEMRKQGARTIGQDEKTSVVYGMPRVAFNIGAVEKQLPLEQIPQAIFSFLD